jgi:hypothetical protein
MPAQIAALRDAIVGGNGWSIAQDTVGEKNWMDEDRLYL